MEYINQMPMFLPPGVKRTPYIDLYKSQNGYIEFYASLRKGNQVEDKSFELLVKMPVNEDFKWDRVYDFHYFEGDPIINEGRLQYVAIRSSNDETWYYGTGKLTFDDFNLTSMMAKGKVIFTFPSFKGEANLELKGEFYCWINVLSAS